jgi:hypothetical protein
MSGNNNHKAMINNNDIAGDIEETELEIRDTIKAYNEYLKRKLLKYWMHYYKTISTKPDLALKEQQEIQLYIQGKVMEIQNNDLILKLTNLGDINKNRDIKT